MLEFLGHFKVKKIRLTQDYLQFLEKLRLVFFFNFKNKELKMSDL